MLEGDKENRGKNQRRQLKILEWGIISHWWLWFYTPPNISDCNLTGFSFIVGPIGKVAVTLFIIRVEGCQSEPRQLAASLPASNWTWIIFILIIVQTRWIVKLRTYWNILHQQWIRKELLWYISPEVPPQGSKLLEWGDQSNSWTFNPGGLWRYTEWSLKTSFYGSGRLLFLTQWLDKELLGTRVAEIQVDLREICLGWYV